MASHFPQFFRERKENLTIREFREFNHGSTFYRLLGLVTIWTPRPDLQLVYEYTTRNGFYLV